MEKKKKKNYCKFHPNIIAIFLCESCNYIFLCSQCAIEHSVKFAEHIPINYKEAAKELAKSLKLEYDKTSKTDLKKSLGWMRNLLKRLENAMISKIKEYKNDQNKNKEKLVDVLLKMDENEKTKDYLKMYKCGKMWNEEKNKQLNNKTLLFQFKETMQQSVNEIEKEIKNEKTYEKTKEEKCQNPESYAKKVKKVIAKQEKKLMKTKIEDEKKEIIKNEIESNKDIKCLEESNEKLRNIRENEVLILDFEFDAEYNKKLIKSIDFSKKYKAIEINDYKRSYLLPIVADEATIIFEMIIKNANPLSFYYSGERLNHDSFECIANVIRYSKYLMTFGLNGYNFPEKAIKLLVNAIKENTQISSFYIESSYDTSTISYFENLIKLCIHICAVYLNFERNSDNEVFSWGKTILESPHLSKINFCSSGVSETGIKYIVNTLNKSTWIKTIILEFNEKLSESALSNLYKALFINSELEEVGILLYRNKFLKEVTIFTNMIAMSQKVKTLYIYFKDIDEYTGTVLANSISKNKSISKLYFVEPCLSSKMLKSIANIVLSRKGEKQMKFLFAHLKNITNSDLEEFFYSINAKASELKLWLLFTNYENYVEMKNICKKFLHEFKELKILENVKDINIPKKIICGF